MRKSSLPRVSRSIYESPLSSKIILSMILMIPLIAQTSGIQLLAQSSADFTLTVYPNYFEVTAGGTVTYPVYCTSVNNFAGTITLTLNGVPAGVVKSFSFSVNPVTLTSNATVESDLTIITNSRAQPDYYSFTVTGSSSQLNHSYQINLSLLPPASAIPPTLILLVGTILALTAYFTRISSIRKSTQRPSER